MYFSVSVLLKWGNIMKVRVKVKSLSHVRLCDPMDCSTDRSVGKESTCNVGDPSSIPGSGRTPGEEIGYPFQYSWASLVAQTVKNPPAI